MVGTNVIAGNDHRTITGWWRTNQKDSYNVYECGKPGTCGQTFAFGRWFGEYRTSTDGLTCHTWCGCNRDNVGKTGAAIGPSDNTWHHFAHVWDGSDHHIYYDGELYTQGPDHNGNLQTVGSGCVFGSREGQFNFQGDIKLMKVYREALNVGQIKLIKGKPFDFWRYLIILLPIKHSVNGFKCFLY